MNLGHHCLVNMYLELLYIFSELFSLLVCNNVFLLFCYYCAEGRSHFWNLHACLHNIFTISPSYTLSLHPTPAYWYQSPRQDLFFPPVLHFCLRYTLISLWHFHVYMYYNSNWLISSIFLLYALIPFLWWFQQALYSSCIRIHQPYSPSWLPSFTLPLSYVTSP
jgi:hypothetical protein